MKSKLDKYRELPIIGTSKEFITPIDEIKIEVIEQKKHKEGSGLCIWLKEKRKAPEPQAPLNYRCVFVFRKVNDSRGQTVNHIHVNYLYYLCLILLYKRK